MCISDILISQIGRIESGEINTTISTAKVIAISLEMNPKDLFDFQYNSYIPKFKVKDNFIAIF